MDEKRSEKKILIEKRKRERRKNVASAKNRVGMERRTGDRRTGRPRRPGPGKPARSR